MTNTNLTGVYFSETVSTYPEYSQEKVPIFLVQTSTAISSIDDQLTKFTSFGAFSTIATNKGLAKTLEYIEDTLTEYGTGEFYVYSIKTDTSTAFTNCIKDMAHLRDCTSLTYVEETKSANTNTLANKISAIQSGLDYLYGLGLFIEGYIIPYGTISDAVSNKGSGVTSEEAVVTAFTSLLSGDGDGRLCVVLPDENAGIIVGKCLATPVGEEAGYAAPQTAPATSSYNFTYTQMVTLMNLGVMFIRGETRNGITTYRIELAVTTSFKSSAADGLLVSRLVADELLRRIEFDANGFIKDKETESNVDELQSCIDTIVDDFAKEELIYREGTNLTASDLGNMKFGIGGTIKPIRSIIEIDVSTTIN